MSAMDKRGQLLMIRKPSIFFITRWLSQFGLVVLIFTICLLCSVVDTHAMGLSPINGTFFPPYLAIDFSEEQWENELKEWKEMGIEYIVIGESAIRNSDGKWQTYYPSQYADIYYYNSVEIILKHCEQANVKCFVACGTYDDFSEINLCRHDEYDASGYLITKGQESFERLVYDTHRYMQELYDLYGEKYSNSFYGFYFVPEVSNSVEFEEKEKFEVGVESLSKALNLTIEKVNQLDPALKLILSPYVNLKKEATWNTHDINTIALFWTEVIKKTNFREGDILAPQDSVGANGVKLSQLKEVTQAYRNAVDAGGKEIELWSNCETFQFPLHESPEKEEFETGQSVYINRLIAQTELVKPYVDSIMTCSFTHYIGKSNCGDFFYQTYRDYLLTGQLDAKPPRKIENVEGEIILVAGKPVVCFNLSPILDDYGVARIEIEKNGNPYTFRIATRYEKEPTSLKPGISQPTSFYDKEFSLYLDSAVYSVSLIDCAENKSEKVMIYAKLTRTGKKQIGAPYSVDYWLLNHITYSIHCEVLGTESDILSIPAVQKVLK